MDFDINKTNMTKSIAIVLMLMHHLFFSATMFCEQYGTYSKIFEWQSVYIFSLVAKICVGMFVFLTAYGITKSYNISLVERKAYDKTSIEIFCFNRYIKLLFNFEFVYVLVFVTSFLREGGLSGVYGVDGWKSGVIYIVFDALGLSDYFQMPTLNETWWYMSLAVFNVFIIPLMILAYKKVGRVTIVIAAIVGIFDFSGMISYLFCIVIGIWCAEEKIFERCYKIRFCKIQYLNRLVKLIINIWIFVVLIELNIRTVLEYSYYTDAIGAVIIGIFCMELSEISQVSVKIMGFIGKHSMNIFLIHTILFEYYFTEFIYGPKNWFLILLLLLGMSLLCSVVIEWLKKVLHYPQVIKRVSLFVDKKFS